MKVAIVSTTGEAEAIVSHTTLATIGRTEDTTALLVESPILPIDKSLMMINTSLEIQNYLLNPKLQTTINETLGFTLEPGDSTIFAFYNGEKFSDWMECCFSGKFMSGNVGPTTGFITGTALRVDCDIKSALPQLERIENFVKETNYRGEVLCTITKDFRISKIGFGHFFGHFALFTEISRLGKVDGILEFLAGIQKELVLGDAIGIANVVSLQPFPLILPQAKVRTILAPQSAEKHLWRVRNESLNFVLVAVRGLSLLEAKKRMRRTMDNMASYNPNIQYRIDYGYATSSFVLCSDSFTVMAEKRLFNPANQPKKEEEHKEDSNRGTSVDTHIDTSPGLVSIGESSQIISTT